MFRPFKGTIINLYIVTSSCVLISRHDQVLSFIYIFFLLLKHLLLGQSDLQTSYHKLSFRFLSLHSFNFLLYKGGLLSTSHINFSVYCTIDTALWRKTQGLCTLLQLSSNCLLANARGHTETCASCRYQQHFCCLENGSGCNRQQLFLLPRQRSCQCTRSRIKQCSPSGQLNSWATKVASACLALPVPSIRIQ